MTSFKLAYLPEASPPNNITMEWGPQHRNLEKTQTLSAHEGEQETSSVRSAPETKTCADGFVV